MSHHLVNVFVNMGAKYTSDHHESSDHHDSSDHKDLSATRRLGVVGPRGSGKTTLLVRRAAEYVERGEGVLFICAPSAVSPNRRALGELRPTIQRSSTSTSPLFSEGVRPGATLVTTWTGFAKAVYRQHDGTRSLLRPHDEKLMVAELLGSDPQSLRVKRLSAARRAFVLSWLGPEELRTHAAAGQATAAWEEVISLSQSFAGRAREAGVIDSAQLVIEATLLLREHGPSWEATFPHVLVDDFESATFAEHRLLATLRSPSSATAQTANSHTANSHTATTQTATTQTATTQTATTQTADSQTLTTLTVAGNPFGPSWAPENSDHSWLASAAKRYALDTTITLARNHLRVREPAFESRLVKHRSLFAPTVANELHALLANGYAPHEIAVVVPETENTESSLSSLRSAAQRRGVSLRSWLTIGTDPFCAAALDHVQKRLPSNLPQTQRSTRSDSEHNDSEHNDSERNVVSLLMDYWRTAAPQLLGFASGFEGPASNIRPTSSISAHIFATMLAKVHASVEAGFSAHVALQSVRTEVHRDRFGVEVLTDSQTRGREWKALIVTGFEEGTRPPRPTAIPRLDHAILNGPDTPTEADRNQRRTNEARARVENVFQRATDRVVAISSPEPGVLTSRFLEPSSQPGREPLEQRVDLQETSPVVFAPKRSVKYASPTENTRPFWAERTVRGSASSLDTFLNCPLEYTYKYVLGVSTPTGPSALVGTITHDILEKFFDPAHAHERTEARLYELFEQRWNDNEFTYRAQAIEYQKTVRSMLDIAMERERAGPASVVAVEHPFEVPFGDYVLSGKIDRVDRIDSLQGFDNRSPGTIGTTGLAITDYKTGNRNHRNDAEDSLQLAVYGIAARRDPVLQAEGELRELALYFLKDGELVHQRVTTDHEERWSVTINDAFAAIAEGQSDPSPTANCEYCSFERVCPTREQGRVVE